jgi:hypothetical protein
MKTYKIIIIILFYLTSCSTKEVKFWDFSDFTLQENAIEDMERINIIYYSGIDPNYESADFYYHLIATKESSQDTVNILTVFNHGIKEQEAFDNYVYLNPDNSLNKMGDSDIYNHKTNGITKVAQNPSLLNDFFLKYPTVIGSIAKKN